MQKELEKVWAIIIKVNSTYLFKWGIIQNHTLCENEISEIVYSSEVGTEDYR